jgi:hypothetical protein
VTAADLAAESPGGAEVITATWRFWEGYEPRLERDVFATAEASSIVAAVDAFCRTRLGSGIDRYEFYSAGVGSTHGLLLCDGRRVVVKVHRATVNVAHLAAVQTVQGHLAEAGFPAPQPLLGPTPLANGIAVAEMLLDRGEWADAHRPEIRELVAGGLSRQIELCRELVGLPGLESSWSIMRRYWRTPHDGRFDFSATADGAEWIERLAAEALRRSDEEGAGEPAIGHNDWRVEQLRFADGELVAAWDWDSLAVGLEPAFVGSSAHCFTADYRVDDLDVVPTLAEALAFIADFEAARGTPFGADERRTAIAALIAMMAYSARCEHADALTDWGSAPARPAPRCVPADSYRGFLAMHGPKLLEVEVSGVPAVCEA